MCVIESRQVAGNRHVRVLKPRIVDKIHELYLFNASILLDGQEVEDPSDVRDRVPAGRR